DVDALPVAGLGCVVSGRESGALLRAEDVLDFAERPDVEAALMALGVGVEAGGEGALPEEHLAIEPTDRLLDPALEQWLAGREEGIGEQLDELGVVVEHLLEVRCQPAFVGRVAGKAAGEVVVDAAFADRAERDKDGVAVAGVVRAEPRTPEKLEQAG